MRTSTTVFATLALLAALLVVSASAEATPNSELNCQPLLLEPMQNVTCTLYVRDSMAEPTTLFAPADFFVRTLPTVSSVRVAVSPLARSLFDPTILTFTVAASSGTQVRIDVMLLNSSIVVRNSGVVANVLTWPATRLSPITCNVAVLQLRQIMTCTAAVAGNTGLPAVVHPAEASFTEDHNAGKFLFLTGQKNLVFNFTANPTLLMSFAFFTIRVTLSSSSAVWTVNVPMAYPQLPATTRSRVQCSGGLAPPICYLSAADSIGPVAFNASHFQIGFEKQVNNAWLPSASFNLTLAPGQTVDQQVLAWALLVNNETSTQRLNILAAAGPTVPLTVATPATAVTGSPFVFFAGVAPTPQDVSLRKCTPVYVLSRNITTCVVDLLNGVTGDSTYFTVSTVKGGTTTTPAYGFDPILQSPVMTFTYTAPMAAQRVDDYISVMIAGTGCMNSPFRVVVYPSATAPQAAAAGGTLPAIVAIGLLFYGSAFGVGGYFFMRRQNRRKRVMVARAEVADQEEVAKAEAEYRQEQIQLHIQQQQREQALGHEVVQMEELNLGSDTEREESK